MSGYDDYLDKYDRMQLTKYGLSPNDMLIDYEPEPDDTLLDDLTLD